MTTEPPIDGLETRVTAVTQLADRLARAMQSEASPAERVVLDLYMQAVRELRGAAVEARTRVGRATATVAAADLFARRQRRRARKASARRPTADSGGSR